MKLGLPPPKTGASGHGTSLITGELRPGDLLDERFLLLETINRGGMATIYKAEDLRNHGELVAVKIPHTEIEYNPNLYTRFQLEEDVGLRLNHPYILKFIPVKDKCRPYIVTEYLHGCTFFFLLSCFGLFPEADALAILSLICEAVQYLHEQGVIHRDIKPENVMICYDGTIRLMDFGIAHAADSRRLTFIGFAPGTPHYMPPERVKGKRGDARTDIYILGAMLYEMLTGTIAFGDEDTFVIMNSRVTGDPEAPRKLNPRISPEAEEIVLHAMERDPAKRYPTIASLKAELDAPGRVQVTGRSKRLEPSTPWKRRWRQLKTILIWSIVPVVIQVVLFFVLWHHLKKK